MHRHAMHDVLQKSVRAGVFVTLMGALGGLGSAQAGTEAVFAAPAAPASACLLYTSPSPRDLSTSRMPSSA